MKRAVLRRVLRSPSRSPGSQRERGPAMGSRSHKTRGRTSDATRAPRASAKTMQTWPTAPTGWRLLWLASWRREQAHLDFLGALDEAPPRSRRYSTKFAISRHRKSSWSTAQHRRATCSSNRVIPSKNRPERTLHRTVAGPTGVRSRVRRVVARRAGQASPAAAPRIKHTHTHTHTHTQSITHTHTHTRHSHRRTASCGWCGSGGLRPSMRIPTGQPLQPDAQGRHVRDQQLRGAREQLQRNPC